MNASSISGYAWLALALALLAPMPASAGMARIYITNSAGDSIHVINPATNKVVQVIKGIEGAHGIAFSPDGSRVYVSNESDSTLDVFDRRSGRLTKKVALSAHPNNIAVAKDGRQRLHRGVGPLAKLLPVFGWYTKHFTDDVDRQPAGDCLDEVTAAGGYVRFDQRGRDLVNTGLEGGDAAGREGAVDGAPDAVVIRRVEEQHHRCRKHTGREGLRISQHSARGLVLRNHECQR